MSGAAVVTASRPKKTYANDGSYDSVKRQIHQQAALYYDRVTRMGLPMEFKDVLQELNMAYVKALASWNPEKAKFNTYCYGAGRNEFNSRIRRMEADRVNLGLVSVGDMTPTSAEEGESEGYESLVSDAEAMSPEDALSARQEVSARIKKLTPNSRRLIVAFLAHENGAGGTSKTLPQLAADLGLAGPVLSAVRYELEAVFGLKLNTLKTIRAK